MKGLNLSKEYYYAYGEKALKQEFSEIFPRLAIGLVGQGSECLGYDDNLSQDHDFEPGFCIFITREDYEKYGFKLERAYAKLPKEFKGYKRQLLSPVGGNRHGVIVIEDFYKNFLGSENAPSNLMDWLYLPSYSIKNACNGEVFLDNLGVFSSIREKLLNFYPEDVRRKKIAGHLALMAQSGQYNYDRLVERGETGASQLAIYEFVKNAISVIFLLNKTYEPFYKWAYKELRGLSILSHLEIPLIALTETPNGNKQAQEKLQIISDVIDEIILELKSQNLTKAVCNDLEKHAYSVQDGIVDNNLRSLHVMAGV